MISPLVSIITPSYNTGKFIEYNIQSVLAQEYPNLEHIVIDGGSNDETLEILKKYSHLKWISESDNGQSEAINKGFRMAKGKFIGWLNSDDIYNQGALLRSVQFLELNKNVDMIYTDLNIIDGENKVYGFTKGLPFTLHNILENNPVKQPTLLMRRTIIDKLLGVNENLHYVMDRELWLRMLINGFEIKYLPGWTNASFRLIEGTKTFQHTPRFRQEWFEVLNSMLSNDFFKRLDSKVMKTAIKNNRSAFHLANMNMAFSDGKTIKGIREALKVVNKNPNILINLGFYNQFLKGLFQIKADRTKKFKD